MNEANQWVQEANTLRGAPLADPGSAAPEEKKPPSNAK